MEKNWTSICHLQIEFWIVQTLRFDPNVRSLDSAYAQD